MDWKRNAHRAAYGYNIVVMPLYFAFVFTGRLVFFAVLMVCMLIAAACFWMAWGRTHGR